MNLSGDGNHHIGTGLGVIVVGRLRYDVDGVRLTSASPGRETGVLAQADTRGVVRSGLVSLAVDSGLEDDGVQTSNEVLAMLKRGENRKARGVEETYKRML